MFVDALRPRDARVTTISAVASACIATSSVWVQWPHSGLAGQVRPARPPRATTRGVGESVAPRWWCLVIVAQNCLVRRENFSHGRARRQAVLSVCHAAVRDELAPCIATRPTGAVVMIGWRGTMAPS